ncbi:hypothetical protein F4861DRAFT_208381 [Xylaria intraflava]|nr:hypothetical protein F4861DRAFT_208381 [Xylaria intraflava]
MDLSPPSLIRSPASSRNSNYSRSPSLGLEYSASELGGPFYKVDSVYDQTYAMDPGNSHDHLSTTTSAEWEENTVIHAVSSIGGPSIIPSDYVSYTNYESTMHAPYSHDLYSATTQLAHTPALSSYAAPPLASMASRSPDPTSSARHPLPYHSTSPMPRIKLENGHDYPSSGELSQYPSPQSTHTLMTEPSSYSSRAGSSGYLSDAPSGSWAKSDYAPTEGDPYYGGPNSSASSLASEQRPRGASVPSSRASRAPKRQTRRLTSKDEANFQCEVEGCGKLFSRSYNYKAHMETHDKKREYPFACTFEDCNKRFVRKTDLQRHHQSVHMKEKNHKCDYCGRLFARKDTLRRHMEDGCSKRFDIGTMDLRGSEGYDTYPIPVRPVPSSTGHLLPPLTLPRGPDNGMVNMPPFMKR